MPRKPFLSASLADQQANPFIACSRFFEQSVARRNGARRALSGQGRRVFDGGAMKGRSRLVARSAVGAGSSRKRAPNAGVARARLGRDYMFAPAIRR